MTTYDLVARRAPGARCRDRTNRRPHTRRPSGVKPVAHNIQILDEIYRGDQDFRWTLDADRLLSRGRESSMGMALVNGQVVATMT